MIKNWNEFIKESNDQTDKNYVDIKLTELKELIDSVSDGHSIFYEWESKDEHHIVVNFSYDKYSSKYEINVIDNIMVKVIDDNFSEISIDSIEEALEIIEKDIYEILSISESNKLGRPKADRTKYGRKIPGKYLTRNRKLMKKEIEEFSTKKDQYKKDWDADYKSGKGGEGKRWETKKSAATIAYQKKYGDK